MTTSGADYTKHGCFFKDNQRKADYVIVVKEDKFLAPLNTYIRQLESKGLHFEKVNGVRFQKMFILIHIPDQVLQYYARVYDIGIDEKKNLVKKEPTSIFVRIFTTPISEIPDKNAGEFTSAERIMIIHKMLETTKYGEGDNEYGISKMVRTKMVEDVYPLHDGHKHMETDLKDFPVEYANDRQLLFRYWANFNLWYKEIPVDMIKKYFGTEIAFYFAWWQHFNVMLLPVAIFGLVVVIVNVLVVKLAELRQLDEICNEDNMHICPTCEEFQYCVFKKLSGYCNFTTWTFVFDNYLTIAFAVLISFWATLFINIWRRKESVLKLKWNVKFEDIGTQPRQRYLDSAVGTEYNELSGKIEPVISNYIQIARTAFAFCVCLFMILLVVGACTAVIMSKINMNSLMIVSGMPFLRKHSLIMALVTASLLQVIFIRLFDAIYSKLCIWLTDIENPRTQADYDTSFLHKRYVLSFANSYIPLFYLAFMKGQLYTVPHHHRLTTYFERDTCQPSTCILGLCIQLAILLVFKKFTGNLVVFFRYKFRKHFLKSSMMNGGQSRLPQYEEEYKLKPFNRYSLSSEFCGIVIDYGFVTFFVAAFPLAPLCVLLNNILESRTDAYKIVSKYRRPVPRKVSGIGSWDGVLLGMTCLSTATNAVVMAFTSDFVSREFYRITKNSNMHGYVNSTLSQYAIEDYDLFKDINPGLDICYYRGMRLPPSDPNKYMLTGDYWTKVTWKLVSVIIFEHIIFLCNGVLAYAIPNIPTSVKQQLDMDRLLAKEAKLHLKSENIGWFSFGRN